MSKVMPAAFSYLFTGAALGSFLALVATVSTLGYAWYRAAETELQIATSTERSDREKQRLATIREHLQTFYVSGGELLNRQLPNPIPLADLDRYIGEVNNWIVTTRDWIETNLGTAASSRFLDQSGISIINWGRAVNPKHNEIINLITKYRDNLSKLIELNAWDDGKTRADLK
jgi:hypothetical protein